MTGSSSALQPLIVDCFKHDGVTHADIDKLVDAGYPWAGISLQCSHGLSYAGEWFNDAWHAARALAGIRYGVDWFRMAYHYLLIGEPASLQAEIALSAVSTAGGWGDGDLWLAVDVERGEQPAGATRSMVEGSVTEFAERVLQLTGRRPVLYAGSYTRDLGISSRMGCCLLWYPQWSSTLNWATVRSMGFDMDSTLLWQMAGSDAPATVPGYPSTTPIGRQDFSVLVRANLPAAESLLWTRTHTGVTPVIDETVVVDSAREETIGI